jgi:hypothetical protein
VTDEREVPDEVDLDGRIDEENGIEYIGKARRQRNGKWTCLADVRGALALVEVTLRWAEPQDEQG